MRLFLAFFVCLISLIPTLVIADWSNSVDVLFPNSIDSSSEVGNSNQPSLFDDGFGSELLTDTNTDCALDNTGKLRARSGECAVPETSEDGRGTSNANGGNGNGNGNGNGDGNNGRNPMQYPASFLSRPARPANFPTRAQPNDVCPLTELKTNQYVICHEGSNPKDIEAEGGRIKNAIWCTLFSSTSVGKYKA